MRVVFAGTPQFAAVALKALLDAGFEIPLVLTQPDRPAGRGLSLQASPVKQMASPRGIPVAQPVSLRLDGRHADVAAQVHAQLRAANADVMVVVAYGLILPRSVLDIPRLGCVNIHASLLPRWRGAAPIQRAIEAGDADTGITIMQMDEGLDTGPMLAKASMPIKADDTASTLHDRLAVMGARMIVETLRSMEAGQATSIPQPEEGVTYAAKIMKDEATLDFSQPANVLARKVNALNPFPGATVMFSGAPVKFWRAEALSIGVAAKPGSVLAANAQEGVLIACGEGALHVTELQKAGGKRMPARDFVRGFAIEGSVLGATQHEV